MGSRDVHWQVCKADSWLINSAGLQGNSSKSPANAKRTETDASSIGDMKMPLTKIRSKRCK